MMTKLPPCRACGAFVPHRAEDCPCCGAARAPSLPGWLRALATVGAGGALAVTLSACYGGPCGGAGCYETTPEPCEDADGDGYCGAQDCDDADAAIHPGTRDPEGDGVDQDCNAVDG